MTTDKHKFDPHNDIIGPGDDNYGRDKRELKKLIKPAITTDKLAEEEKFAKIIRTINLIQFQWISMTSDKSGIETNPATHRIAEYVMQLLKDEKDEYAKLYHEEKMKGELGRFISWIDNMNFLNAMAYNDHEKTVDEYLKTKNK